MGKEDDAKCFYEKGQAYHHIFDKEKGWFRPRKADGTWVEGYLEDENHINDGKCEFLIDQKISI